MMELYRYIYRWELYVYGYNIGAWYNLLVCDVWLILSVILNSSLITFKSQNMMAGDGNGVLGSFILSCLSQFHDHPFKSRPSIFPNPPLSLSSLIGANDFPPISPVSEHDPSDDDDDDDDDDDADERSESIDSGDTETCNGLGLFGLCS